MNNTVKVATHSGIFHADEVFAIATLQIYFKKQKKKVVVTRTRDLESILSHDIVVDVGRKYNADDSHFDHHQASEDLIRVNGIPYASFGLVWKHYGREIVSSDKAFEVIEKKLVLPIDAFDNAMKISKSIVEGVDEYLASYAIFALSHAYGNKRLDFAFKKALSFAQIILKGEIKRIEQKIKAEAVITKEVLKQGEPEILILNKYMPNGKALSNFKNVKLKIFPDLRPGNWCVQTVKEDEDSVISDRVLFPVSWRGKENAEVAAASGIPEAIFCHKSGYFAVTKSKESAINMAKKALLDQ